MKAPGNVMTLCTRIYKIHSFKIIPFVFYRSFVPPIHSQSMCMILGCQIFSTVKHCCKITPWISASVFLQMVWCKPSLKPVRMAFYTVWIVCLILGQTKTVMPYLKWWFNGETITFPINMLKKHFCCVDPLEFIFIIQQTWNPLCPNLTHVQIVTQYLNDYLLQLLSAQMTIPLNNVFMISWNLH